jgi:transposase-like protein
METQMTLLEAVTYFADYENCHLFMTELRWPSGVVRCPRCGSDHVVYLANARVWKCYQKHDHAKFTLKTGTVFEDSPLPLSKWLVAVWQVVNCRNGVSSWELHRALGVTQKTAWFMLHRVRLAMQDEKDGGMLGGYDNQVEVDETFIGGKARNMHKDRKARAQKLTGRDAGKTIVLGILERRGEVRAKVISDRKASTIRPFVNENIAPGSEVHTDEFGDSWREVDTKFTHEIVNHMETYVNGNVHTNGIENFWSLLKRCIGGTYIAVEPFHLFRYIDEQAFRFNNRKHETGEIMSDYERFTSALAHIVGKRLTYKQLTGKEEVRAEAF